MKWESSLNKTEPKLNKNERQTKCLLKAKREAFNDVLFSHWSCAQMASITILTNDFSLARVADSPISLCDCITRWCNRIQRYYTKFVRRMQSNSTIRMVYYTSIVLLFDNISIVYDRDPNIGLVFEERFFSIELFCCCSDCISIAMLIRDLWYMMSFNSTR